MTDRPKGPEGVKKYRNGLLALGAGMILDNPLVSAIGLYLLYSKAGEGEEAEAVIEAGNAGPLSAWEVTYNRAIFALGVGLAVAAFFHSRPVVAAAVVITTTIIGILFIRQAGRQEKKVDLLDAAAAFKRFVESKKLGYSIAPVSEKNERLCFRVSPLWLPRHFVVTVLPGTGKAGGQGKALEGADVAVQWFPTARTGKPLQHNGVLIANGGPALLEAAIRGALSEMLVAEDLEPAQT